MSKTTTGLYEKLLAYESDGANPADGRRVIADERIALHAAYAALERVEGLAKHGRAEEHEVNAAREHVQETLIEATRVLRMWKA